MTFYAEVRTILSVPIVCDPLNDYKIVILL